MATEIIHEHDSTTGSDPSGMIVGIVLLVLFVILIFYLLGNGVFRGIGGTNIQVPDKVNVNLNQGTK